MSDDQATAAAESPSVSADAQAAAASGAATFGAVLAAERQRQGISVTDMAGRLRLHPKQLAAIEAEDFAALPTAPFLRGFVRNYAKELRIDAAPLLAELGERLAPKPETTGSGNGSGPRGPGGDRLPRALVITAAVGALIVFGVIGVMSSRDASRAPGSQEAGTAATDGKAAPASDPAPVATAPSGGTAATGDNNASSPVTEVPAPSTEVKPSTASAGAPATAPDTAAPSNAGDSSAAGASASPPASASSSTTGSASASTPGKAAGRATPPPSAGSTPPAGTAASTPAAPAAPASRSGAIVRSVRLSFNDAAWVRVEDGEGKVLLSQINEAGTEQRVAGRSPLRLIIGNASNVTLDVSGREVDLKPRTSPDNVARLTVE